MNDYTHISWIAPDEISRLRSMADDDILNSALSAEDERVAFTTRELLHTSKGPGWVKNDDLAILRGVEQ